MAVDKTPRSVADATRFTSNTPHANAKARKAGGAPTPSPSSTRTSGSRTGVPPPPKRPAPGAAAAAAAGVAGGAQRTESLDEKVRRLRAAHLAARNHEVSKMDKVISSSRRYMDAAHRYTVLGLIGFSGLALLVTVYATVDMMVYNRKRRNEFFALQQQLQAGSLESARLAYMTGKATEEQISLVEEATEKAKKAGLELPSILGNPGTSSVTGTAAAGAETTIRPGESLQESSLSAVEEVKAPESKGLGSWLFGGLKKEDTAAGASSVSFNPEEAAVSGRESRASAVVHAVSDQTDALKDKAKSALDTEKENQRKGGPLDQVGLQPKERKTGWFW